MRTLLTLSLFLAGLTCAFGSTVIYDSIPNPLPGNYPSLGYQATSTQEAGAAVAFAGSYRLLETVTVGMSNWAKQSDYGQASDTTGYMHELTLNIYSTVGLPYVSDLLASKTINAFIPWRPEVFGFNGLAFTVDFDFSSLNLTLPNEVVIALAFNTQTHGYTPTGQPGPYNSLNLGLPNGTYVGSNLNPDQIVWNTSYAGFYTDGGLGGVGTLRTDTGWTGYTPAFTVTAATPEPGTLAVAGAALAALAWLRRRR